MPGLAQRAAQPASGPCRGMPIGPDMRCVPDVEYGLVLIQGSTRAVGLGPPTALALRASEVVE